MITAPTMMIMPAIPTAFLISREQDNSTSTESENIPPMMGTNLSIVYFAVLIDNPSNVEPSSPCMAMMPKKIVKLIPIPHLITLLISAQKPLNLTDVEKCRITSYNVCYTKLLRFVVPTSITTAPGLTKSPVIISGCPTAATSIRNNFV